jgi:hypothetical protein
MFASGGSIAYGVMGGNITVIPEPWRQYSQIVEAILEATVAYRDLRRE